MAALRPRTTFALSLLSLFGLGLPLLDLIWGVWGGLRPLGLLFGLCAVMVSGVVVLELAARSLRATVVGLLVLSALGWSFLGWHLYRTQGFFHQVRNLERMKSVVRSVETYHDEHGAYPATLEEALAAEAIPPAAADSPGDRTLDAFGNPFHYEARGTTFLLASPGRGGRFETPDLWQLRDRVPPGTPPIDACGDPANDVVYSEHGLVQVCGK